MKISAAIFDMDGLLIDSEPLWQEAGKETLRHFGHDLSTELYHTSTGLRTEEWVEYWFHYFGIPMKHAAEATSTVIRKAIEKIDAEGEAMPGVDYILDLCHSKGYQLGLASSSPMELIDVVVDKLNIRSRFHTLTSAGELPYGKPHPQVFLNCAAELKSNVLECLVLEDSFNGLIAAKAARMRCAVVPAASEFDHPKWGPADLRVPSLKAITTDLLEQL